MTVVVPGLALTDHTISVPLDHARPDGPTIEVFARSAVDPAKRDQDLPWLLYLQGGPGGKSPRPASASGWLEYAVRTHRVLLLDQRGTGRSTPITPASLAKLPPGALRHFRADAIVSDAEVFRRRIAGGRPWETLGNSYGGFVTLRYLSQAPEGLAACYVTGGLPGLTATAEDVYTRTYARVAARFRAHLARFPDDDTRLQAIAERVRDRDVRLPNGDRLTIPRLQMLGVLLGTAENARLHWWLEEAFDGDELAAAFLADVTSFSAFAGHPLYAVLHESIYAQGAATRWSAERVRPPELAVDADPVRLTGEMIYPWMFDDIGDLRPFRGVAEELANIDDWPVLYDLDRLSANEVPVAAAVFHDDMYVDVHLSLATAAAIGNTRAWVTNEWGHDGLHASGHGVLARLIDMVAGRA